MIISNSKSFETILKKAFEEYCSREYEDFPTDDELKMMYPPSEQEWLALKELLTQSEDGE